MGFVYIGGNKSKSYGYAKIGETNRKYLSYRISEIRKEEGAFCVYSYLVIANSDSKLTRAIESYMRDNLSKTYHHVGKDHFIINENSVVETEYAAFALNALNFATEYCDMHNINYIIKTDYGKKRKGS